MTAHPSGLVTEAFEAQRDRLRAVAHRVLGSYADAEDVVQDAWLRLVRQDEKTIGNLAGWLTTVVGRISLDLLRSRGAHPETAYEHEFASLVVMPDDGLAPDEQVALADSVGLALLVVLDSLTPSERLAFVLHDMFAVPFHDVGQILGKSADATKMVASRARRKAQATDRPAGPGRAHREVVEAFGAAALSGDFKVGEVLPDHRVGELLLLGRRARRRAHRRQRGARDQADGGRYDSPAAVGVLEPGHSRSASSRVGDRERKFEISDVVLIAERNIGGAGKGVNTG